MELILHIGLPKTGSTFLQHLFSFNRAPFAAAGVHYCARAGWTSAHRAAWPALVGQLEQAVDLVHEALRSGCPRAFMSSEDLAPLLFRAPLAMAMCRAFLDAGITRLRLLLYIRRQDAMFWGLYDTISRSLFADPVAMFYDVMRTGYYLINDTQGHANAPYYCFSFDHNRIVGGFADQVLPHLPALSIEVRDFDAEPEFPGRALLTELGLLECIEAYPGEQIQNRRRPIQDVIAGHTDNFAKVVGPELGGRMRALLEARAQIGESQQAAMSAALLDRFLPGNPLLLQRFGVASSNAAGSPLG